MQFKKGQETKHLHNIYIMIYMHYFTRFYHYVVHNIFATFSLYKYFTIKFPVIMLILR